MANVRIGGGINTFGPEGIPAAGELVATVRAMEADGYDSVWVGDHLFFHVPVLEAMTTMAVLAGATERIRVGASVLLGVLREPVWFAKSLATMQHFAPGRLLVGLGIGGEFPAEFEAVGVPVSERGRRTDELIGYLRAVWTGDAAGHEPVHYPLPAHELTPKPDPVPPIWIGGRSERALERAAEKGDGWLPMFHPVEDFAALGKRYRERLEELGRDGVLGMHVYVRTGPTAERAWDEAGRFLSSLYGLGAERLRKHCVCGTPEQVAEVLRAYVEAGAEQLVVRPAGTDTREQLGSLAPYLAEIAR